MGVGAGVGSVLSLAVGGGARRIPNGCQSLWSSNDHIYNLGGGGKAAVAGVVYC